MAKRRKTTGPIQRELHRVSMDTQGLEVHVVIPVLHGKQLIVDMADGEVVMYERSVAVEVSSKTKRKARR